MAGSPPFRRKVSIEKMNYAAHTRVTVYPFSRQVEGEEVIIGNPDTATFLVLPTDAVALLDDLSKGKTVGEVALAYQRKHGEVPDLDNLLDILERKGFVQSTAEQRLYFGPARDQLQKRRLAKKPAPVRFHFENFPQPLAQRLCSRQVLLVCSLLISLALIATLHDPVILPSWDAHYFTHHLTLMQLLVMAIGYATVFLHEMAHLVAARAVGVSSRLGISHRLWYLVAETDMTGVWSIPRTHRYFTFLAGPLLDTVSASILILLLFAEHHRWIALHPIGLQLSRAMLLTYLLRLLWQCHLFVRTDFYYVIATIFRCKNLIKDTEIFLLNQLSRLMPAVKPVSQIHIPPRERRFIRWYAVLWLLGRLAAVYVLVSISLPLTWHYGLMIGHIWHGGFQAHPYAFIDALVLFWLYFLTQGIGLFLFLRSCFQSRRYRYE
jgi:hypothetical protein